MPAVRPRPQEGLVSALVTLPPLPPRWTRLLLCRHGETASNASKLLQGGDADTPLNLHGYASCLTTPTARVPRPQLPS